MDGLAQEVLGFSEVVAYGFEGNVVGFKDAIDSNENDRYIQGESHNVSDNMVDENAHGVDVNSSNFVPDDGLAVEMLGVENEIVVPKVGMKFADETEVFEFYKKYAYQVGFPVRKRNTKRGDDGIVLYVSFTCSREGRRNRKKGTSLHPPPTIETGCKARLTACSDACGIFRINVVHLEHNHRTSPTKSRLYRCNRQLSERVKRQLEVNDIAGIPVHKSFNSTVVEAGGFDNMTCVEKDCRNFIEKVRRLRLGEGDAAAIQAYFSKMQARSPGFFYSMDLDEECRLRNVFWADNRCREAYKEFGDVVTFDTTYLTNKYDMPFAPFVGVNHHGQSTLLGCGLVSNEDTNTFVWIFSTWLECMNGQAPTGIITDQDRAMQNAIQIVFPYTKHRWCLWHILKKLPEKFGYHNAKDLIMHAIHVLVYDTLSCEAFDEGWLNMLDHFELQDHHWLNGLYNERSRWVPCYLKTTFWAGMSTTQRSESMNAFFDGYVHSKTSLKLFVEQYERALRSKVEKEFQADFRSFSQMVPCATKYDMEKQFQDVYTITKFREFQTEFTGTIYCDVLSVEVFPGETKYEVREDIILSEGMKKKIFTVYFRRGSCEIECNCHLFEFRGIICKHAVSVLIRNDVQLLPEKYVLRRWRRDVTRPYMRVPTTYDGLVSTAEQLRYEKLCLALTKMADLVATNEEWSNHLLQWVEFQTNQLSKPNCSNMGAHLLGARNDESIFILDPKLTKSKGAPKKLRKKSPLETNYKKSNGRKKDPSKGVTKNPKETQDQVVSFSQTHQLFLTQESVDGNHGL